MNRKTGYNRKKAYKKDLTEKIVALISDNQMIEFAEPIITVSRRGLELSVTDDEKDDMVLRWSEFEDWNLNYEHEEALEKIQLLESMVKRMKKAYAKRLKDEEEKP